MSDSVPKAAQLSAFFPRTTNASRLRVTVHYPEVYARLLADSSTAYIEHKVTVTNDEPVSWQVLSSISVIFSVDEKQKKKRKKIL